MVYPEQKSSSSKQIAKNRYSRYFPTCSSLALVMALTAAVHGDELNGVSIIHHLAFGDDHIADTNDDHIDVSKLAGTLLCVPVVNVEGMILQTRSTPDGRDLNRLFPGKATGNQAQRIAHALFEQVVRRANYLIDLHTAPYTVVGEK